MAPDSGRAKLRGVERSSEPGDGSPGGGAGSRPGASRYASVLDFLPDPVVILRDDRIEYANAAARQVFGVARDEDFLARSPFDFVAPESRALAIHRIRRVLEGAPTQVIDLQVVRLDGRRREVQVHGALLEDERGKAIQVVFRDVTDRLASERALRDAHELLRRHLENTPLGIVEWDGDLRITRFAGRAEEIFGWSAGEVLGKRPDEVPWVAPSDWPAVEAAVGQMRTGTRPVTVVSTRNFRKDGSVIHCRWFNSSLYDREGRLASVLSLVQDDTERELAVASLKESETRFRTLTENMPVGVIETDLDGNATYVNEAFARIASVPAQECLGRAAWTRIHPDDRRIVSEAMAESLGTGSGPNIEVRITRPDGSTRIVRSWGVALRNAEGRPAGFLVVNNDVTELRALRNQLAVSSRLAAMGTLVAGVAHEINNPLAGTISGQGLAIEDLRDLRTRMARAEAVDPGEIAKVLDGALECLDDAQVGVRRIERIVKDLTTLGRPDPRRTRVRLIDVVEEAMRWLSRSPGSSVSLEVKHEGPPDVTASPGQLLQVVVNLVTNAARSIPLGRDGRIEIRLGRGPQGTAVLEVEDDGAGIPAEVADRIFDPFFTTREVGEGMGLGLPVCHAIVTGHGGTITFTSEAGKGSTFRVELPPVEP